MSVDLRSIDFANSASIDMMALNNKVVNMRQVVKRTKVQVINKLCKNIAALKKKKGTEEQRAQNIRKAERLIEEIDSIKRLKEDKVSKYSLANTTSFTDICKTSLSAGPRAMARLADHSIMQKVVKDFRTQHPDWRDLAAYLLVKQTGRRFKTKKQKQGKKLSKSVENIQASETMTKAYIQERFGKEGLKKAEQRFDRKRKRAQVEEDSQVEKQVKEANSVDEKETMAEVKLDGNKNADADSISIETSKDASKSNKFKKTSFKTEVTLQTSTPDTKHEHEENYSTESNNVASSLLSEKELIESMQKKSEISKEKKIKPKKKSMGSSNISVSDSESDSTGGKAVNSHNLSIQVSVDSSSRSKNECVVKEINISDASGSYFDQEGISDESNSDEEDAHTSLESNSDDDGLSQSKPAMGERQKKKAELKSKKVPVMLTSKPEKAISDPFFVGTDEEEVEGDAPNHFDEALLLESGDDEFVESGARGNKSMFYNPHGEEIYRKGKRVPVHSWSSSRGGGRWQRQERGRDWERRGRTSGHQRGRGMSITGAKTRGATGGGYPRGNESFHGTRFNHTGEMKHDRANSNSNNTLTTSSEKLHPSWEASKKRKAEQSGIQAFKGSKITFGEDD